MIVDCSDRKEINSTFTAVSDQDIEHVKVILQLKNRLKLATSAVDFWEGDLVPLKTGLVISVQLCMHGVG